MSKRIGFYLAPVLAFVCLSANAGLDELTKALANPQVKATVNTPDLIGVDVQLTERRGCRDNYEVRATYPDKDCTLVVALNSCGTDSKSAITSKGCQAAGASVPSFDKDIKPVFATKCNMCHGAGKPLAIDYSNYQNAVANASKINDQVVVKKAMPKAMPIDQSLRDLIAAWLNGGTPP